MNLKRKVRKMKIKFLVVALLLSFAIAFSANTDRFYQGTVTVEETYNLVVYTWVYTIPADSTDQMHSPAMFIGDCNGAYGYAGSEVSAASDVNLFWHFGQGDIWYSRVTPAGLDASTNSAKYDTIGVTTGTDDLSFNMARYLIIEADGGGSTADPGEIVTVSLSFVKVNNFMDSVGRMVEIGRVIKSKPYNWVNP